MCTKLDNTKIKIGDTIKIISFPRKFDNADGFAGVVGVVIHINRKERFKNGRGSITLKLVNGATFVGTGISRMTCEKLS